MKNEKIIKDYVKYLVQFFGNLEKHRKTSLDNLTSLINCTNNLIKNGEELPGYLCDAVSIVVEFMENFKKNFKITKNNEVIFNKSNQVIKYTINNVSIDNPLIDVIEEQRNKGLNDEVLWNKINLIYNSTEEHKSGDYDDHYYGYDTIDGDLAPINTKFNILSVNIFDSMDSIFSSNISDRYDTTSVSSSTFSSPTFIIPLNNQCAVFLGKKKFINFVNSPLDMSLGICKSLVSYIRKSYPKQKSLCDDVIAVLEHNMTVNSFCAEECKKLVDQLKESLVVHRLSDPDEKKLRNLFKKQSFSDKDFYGTEISWLNDVEIKNTLSPTITQKQSKSGKDKILTSTSQKITGRKRKMPSSSSPPNSKKRRKNQHILSSSDKKILSSKEFINLASIDIKFDLTNIAIKKELEGLCALKTDNTDFNIATKGDLLKKIRNILSQKITDKTETDYCDNIKELMDIIDIILYPPSKIMVPKKITDLSLDKSDKDKKSSKEPRKRKFLEFKDDNEDDILKPLKKTKQQRLNPTLPEKVQEFAKELEDKGIDVELDVKKFLVLVQLASFAAQQTFVGGILQKSVLELVDDLGRQAAAINKLGVDESGQCLIERRFCQLGDGGEQLVAEGPA